MPVYDRLVRYAILVVQDLEQLLERLHESGVGITINLSRVDEPDFCFGAITEFLQDRCSSLVDQYDNTRHVMSGIYIQ